MRPTRIRERKMKKNKLLIGTLLVVSAVFMMTACGGNDKKNKGEKKVNDSKAENVGVSNANDMLVGTWVLTDWDDQFDEGGYDPGDKWKFQSNGDFAGFGLRGSGLSEGKWSVKDKMLTIVLNEERDYDNDSNQWIINGTVNAEISELTKNSMHLSGKVNFDIRCISGKLNGETQNHTQRMDIRLKPESVK